MAFSEIPRASVPENRPEEGPLDVEKFNRLKEKIKENDSRELQEREGEEKQAERFLAAELQGGENRQEAIGSLSEFIYGTIETSETADVFRKKYPELVLTCDEIAEAIKNVMKFTRRKEVYDMINQNDLQKIPKEQQGEAKEYIAYMVLSWKTEEGGVEKRKIQAEEEI